MFKKWLDGKSKTGRIFIWFVGIYAPLMLLIMGVSWAYYLSEESQHIQVLRHQETFHVELQTETFQHEFQSIVADLLVLSAHQQLALIADGSTEADYAALANELLSFCRNKKMYDQVRLLDATGMERVRINFNRDHPVIVPKAALKNKGNRYYFKDTIRLQQGEVFVSPLDLNVEGGTIERPLKPMIRFGIPVFNNRGEKRGILVLNYFAELLITQLENRSHDSLAPGFGMLLNSDGYFFKGIQNEDEWGFMIPGRKDRTFSHLFPKEWGEITRNPSGQFIDVEGLFTFTTVFPLAEGLKSSTGSPNAWGASVRNLGAKQYLWKIVTFTPHASILGITRKLRHVLLFSNALLALLAGMGIWLLSEAIIRRNAAEDEMEHMAHFDLLTGLPNRPLLYDRLGMALAHARREKKKLAVLFLDLDGFKAVNDRFGHQAGDTVLQEVAHRLQQCVGRQTDTVARLGGDEFALLLTAITQTQDAEMIAAKLIASLGEPIKLNDGQPCGIGASIGIAIYPENGLTQDELLSNSDAAMYAAKENGKNNYRFCSC